MECEKRDNPPHMDSAVEALLTQVEAINQDAAGLAARLRGDQFNWSPDGRRWSVGQSLEHLSITNDRYLPVFDQALESLRRQGRRVAAPPTLGWFERMFLRMLEPPVRLKVKAPASFVAPAALDPAAALAHWTASQEAFERRIRACDGLDMKATSVKSQFGPVSFSLYGTIAILLAHQRRHIWQMREVMREPGFPG